MEWYCPEEVSRDGNITVPPNLDPSWNPAPYPDVLEIPKSEGDDDAEPGNIYPVKNSDDDQTPDISPALEGYNSAPEGGSHPLNTSYVPEGANLVPEGYFLDF